MKKLIQKMMILSGVLICIIGCDSNPISQNTNLIDESKNISSILNPVPELNTVVVGEKLVYPNYGDVLDNGCRYESNICTWNFSWDPVKGATKYQLYVKGKNASMPVINNQFIYKSKYEFSHYGYIINYHRHGWSWKTRAFVNGRWTNWTPEIIFDVEPLNTDC